jgi:CBS domain-containing protein
MNRMLTEREGVLRRMLVRVLDQATHILVLLGKKLGRPALASVPVSAVMLTRLPTVASDQPLEDVVQLLVANRYVEVPVFDNNTAVGVLTRGDLERGLERSGPHSLVGEAPRHDVITVSPSDSLADVLAKLRQSPNAIAVVIDRGAPVGLLTVDRLVAYAHRAAA